MNTLERITQLLDQRGWTLYQLSKKANLNQSTLPNAYARNNDPSVSTLEAICKAFEITMSEFFSDGEDPATLTFQQKELLKEWDQLNEDQKQILLALLKNMK